MQTTLKLHYNYTETTQNRTETTQNTLKPHSNYTITTRILASISRASCIYQAIRLFVVSREILSRIWALTSSKRSAIRKLMTKFSREFSWLLIPSNPAIHWETSPWLEMKGCLHTALLRDTIRLVSAFM